MQLSKQPLLYQTVRDLVHAVLGPLLFLSVFGQVYSAEAYMLSIFHSVSQASVDRPYFLVSQCKKYYYGERQICSQIYN